MTDLVKRLRLPVAPEHHDPFKSGHWCRIHTQVLDAISAERKEAADEIEAFEMWKRGSRAYAAKLEDEIERLERRIKEMDAVYDEKFAVEVERDRLRADVASYKTNAQGDALIIMTLTDENKRLRAFTKRLSHAGGALGDEATKALNGEKE